MPSCSFFPGSLSSLSLPPPFFLMSNRYDHKIIAETSLVKPACPSSQSAVWDRPSGCCSGETTQRLSHLGGPNSRARQRRVHTCGGSDEGRWDSSCIQRAGVAVFKEIEITGEEKKGEGATTSPLLLLIVHLFVRAPHPSTLIACLLASHRAN